MRGRRYESVTGSLFKFSNFVKNTANLATRKVMTWSPKYLQTPIKKNSQNDVEKELYNRYHPNRNSFSSSNCAMSKRFFEEYNDNKNSYEFYDFHVRNDSSPFLKAHEIRVVQVSLINKKTDLAYPNNNIFSNYGHMFVSYVDPRVGLTMLFGPFTHGSPKLYAMDVNNNCYVFPVNFFSEIDFAGVHTDQFYFPRKWIISGNLIKMFENSLTRKAMQRIVAENPRFFMELVYDKCMAIVFDPNYSLGPSPRLIHPKSVVDSKILLEESNKLKPLKAHVPTLDQLHRFSRYYEEQVDGKFVRTPLITMHVLDSKTNKVITPTFIDE